MTTPGDFQGQADAYAARPGYPPALVERLLVRAGVRAGDRVADLGAGTGIFTRLLAGRGLVIDAVEPGEAMRARAPALPGVTWSAGSFEATGLPDASLAWAVAAQAFHWADPLRALPELHRVLAPGAAFTALWNDRRAGDSPVLDAAWALIKERVPDFDEAYRNRDWAAVLTASGHFAGVVTDDERHAVTMERDRFVDLWRSHNRLAVAAGPGLAALIADLERLVAAEATVDVPYTTRSWTTWRA